MVRLIKILLGALLTIFITVSLVFFMVRGAPGGPFDGEKAMSPAQHATLQKIYGLDKPIMEQYGRFLLNLAQGRLGVSFALEGQGVGDIISKAFPVSLELGAIALFVAVIFGVPLGFYWAAKQQGSASQTLSNPGPAGSVEGQDAANKRPARRDRMSVATDFNPWPSSHGIMLLAMLPSFVAAPIVQQLVLLCGGVAYGYEGIVSLILPGLVLGLYFLPFIARLTQNGFTEESRALYLRVAQAKGLRRIVALWSHGYRAALGPVLAYLGPTAAGLVTGAFVVETVWGLPGMGRFFVNAVFNRDDTLLLGLVTFYIIVLIVFNTLIELILSAWNPSAKKEVAR